MQLNTDDVLTFLTIAAVVLLLILMYHLIFIAVNLRKITKNLSEVTDEIEDVVMKPLSFLNEAFGWLMLLASQFQDDEDTPKKKKRD